MKQVKFFLVALMAVVMGMSVTSCMKGENNTVVPVDGVITLVNTFPYQFQVEGSNVIFEASSMSIPGLSSDAYSGDIVLLNAQYDTETQPVDQNTKKIIVEAAGAEKLNVNSYVSSDDVTYNRSIISLSRYGSSVSPYLYSAKWIIFPMPFCVEKEENVSSHTFYLVYDKENTANDDNTMVLRLRHTSTEDADKEKTVVTRYRAFNIANVVSRFEGTKLKTIKIIVPEQTGDSPKIEEGSNNGYKDATYTINDYDKYVTNN